MAKRPNQELEWLLHRVASRLTGVSADTLRMWSAAMVSQTCADDAQVRVYTDADWSA